MVAAPPVCDFGWKAPAFSLPATDGSVYTLNDIRGARGTLLMFICNHCPYVLAVLDRMVRDAHELMDLGVGVAAVCANDADRYPADSFANMRTMAVEQGFRFPYLHDEGQSVARAYDAACTPDFFGFGSDLDLQYRGRLDASRAQAGPPGLRRDLFEAMQQVVETGQGPEEQIASMGCSIKWKPGA